MDLYSIVDLKTKIKVCLLDVSAWLVQELHHTMECLWKRLQELLKLKLLYLRNFLLYILTMRTVLFLIGALISILSVHAQDSSKTKLSEYRAAATKLHDLIHTKLDIKLDYDKAWLYGKAWITLKPHFY